MYRRRASPTKVPLVTTDIDDPESLPLTIVRAVAAVDDETPTDLPPLNDVIDPEALSTLLASATDPVQLRFQYCGYDIVVTTAAVSVY